MYYVAVLPPIMVPMNVGDIPDQLPPLNDYSTTVPFNTDFPGLLDHPPSSTGFSIFYLLYLVDIAGLHVLQ